jgi:hypothetical protein
VSAILKIWFFGAICRLACQKASQYDSIAAFFAGVMHPNGSLQNCNAPENERFFRKKRQKAAVTLTRTAAF